MAEIDMGTVLAGPGSVALTLVTCGGTYQGDFSYESHVIVVAKLV